jgi:hypothetical protein
VNHNYKDPSLSSSGDIQKSGSWPLLGVFAFDNVVFALDDVAGDVAGGGLVLGLG